jgi:hypothetical protein
MTLPDSVKIGGHTYSLLFPYCFKERADLSGQKDSDLLEIRVSEVDSCGNVRADSVIAVTMIHELIHAIDSSAGLKELNNGSKEQERIVECLANGLYQVFKDNPCLLDIFK